MYRSGHARARLPSPVPTLPHRHAHPQAAWREPFAKVLHEMSIPLDLMDSIARPSVLNETVSLLSPSAQYFPPLTQRGSSQYPCRFPSRCTRVLSHSDFGGRAALSRNPHWFHPRTLPALSLSLSLSRCVLIRSNFTWPCQLPAAAAAALVRFPLPSPIAISNHSIAHLMKNTLNKRKGKKDERRDRF